MTGYSELILSSYETLAPIIAPLAKSDNLGFVQ